jgi:hypothetical protein
MAINAMKPLKEQKQKLTDAHQSARKEFDTKLKDRWDAEQQARASRTRKGWAGVWDFMTGRYFKVRKQNELEVQFAKERDRTERHGMITAQLKERQELQVNIKIARRREAEQVLALYRDAAKFRRMLESEVKRDKDRGRDSNTIRRKRDLGLG